MAGILDIQIALNRPHGVVTSNTYTGTKRQADSSRQAPALSELEKPLSLPAAAPPSSYDSDRVTRFSADELIIIRRLIITGICFFVFLVILVFLRADYLKRKHNQSTVYSGKGYYDPKTGKTLPFKPNGRSYIGESIVWVITLVFKVIGFIFLLLFAAGGRSRGGSYRYRSSGSSSSGVSVSSGSSGSSGGGGFGGGSSSGGGASGSW